MSKVIFIDEGWFDMEEHEDYNEREYEGFSEMSVYDIPDYDGYNEDLDRDEYNNVGEVLVGFCDGDATVLEVIDGDFEAYDVEAYYPPL